MHFIYSNNTNGDIYNELPYLCHVSPLELRPYLFTEMHEKEFKIFPTTKEHSYYIIPFFVNYFNTAMDKYVVLFHVIYVILPMYDLLLIGCRQ